MRSSWYPSAVRRLYLSFVLLVASVSVAAAEPPDTHEYLQHGPSGFWTSNHPALGGAYKYRLLAVGVAVCALTAFLVIRMLKRASAQPRATIARAPMARALPKK